MVALLITGLAACAGGDKESRATTVRQRIGQSYGVQYFDQIEQVQYTFNVRKGDTHARRFWIWEPKRDRVTFDGMDYKDPITYYRSDLQTNPSNKLKSIDAWFINDNYWFLFPFHVAGDTQTTVEDVGRKKLPVGDGELAGGGDQAAGGLVTEDAVEEGRHADRAAHVRAQPEGRPAGADHRPLAPGASPYRP